MKTKARKFFIAAAAGLLFTALTPAVSKADHRFWGGGGYYHQGGFYGGRSHSGFNFSIGFGTGFFRPYRSTYYYCPPPRVYYAPPVVYAPPPVSYYYCAPPTYYAPAPYYCAPDSSYFSVRYHYGY